MANYYTHIVGRELLPATEDEFNKLVELLNKAEEENDAMHGMNAEYVDGCIHMYDDESGTLEEFTDEILHFLGELISKAGWPYWEFGVCWYCDKRRPEGFGGTTARIYPDGGLAFAEDGLFTDAGPADLKIVQEMGADLTVIFEAARVALGMEPYALGKAMDLSDEEITRIREKLQELMGDTGVTDKVIGELD